MKAMIDLLRSLDTAPGRDLEETQAVVRFADLRIMPDEKNANLRVDVDGATLPRLRLLDLPEGADTQAQGFARDLRYNALALIKAAEQRVATMLRVGEALAHLQEAYFFEGRAALRPLTMAQLAADAGVHHSTVSRICATRSVQTPFGVEPLRFFFSGAVGGEDGLAATVVADRIRRLIAEEPRKKPLSDSKLTYTLQSEGIDIARRTVAKYREGMGIPSSVLRRRHFAQGA
jgi:RNA polymerase sigma-54 factor